MTKHKRVRYPNRADKATGLPKTEREERLAEVIALTGAEWISVEDLVDLAYADLWVEDMHKPVEERQAHRDEVAYATTAMMSRLFTREKNVDYPILRNAGIERRYGVVNDRRAWVYRHVQPPQEPAEEPEPDRVALHYVDVTEAVLEPLSEKPQMGDKLEVVGSNRQGELVLLDPARKVIWIANQM